MLWPGTVSWIWIYLALWPDIECFGIPLAVFAACMDEHRSVPWAAQWLHSTNPSLSGLWPPEARPRARALWATKQIWIPKPRVNLSIPRKRRSSSSWPWSKRLVTPKSKPSWRRQCRRQPWYLWSCVFATRRGPLTAIFLSGPWRHHRCPAERGPGAPGGLRCPGAIWQAQRAAHQRHHWSGWRGHHHCHRGAGEQRAEGGATFAAWGRQKILSLKKQLILSPNMAVIFVSASMFSYVVISKLCSPIWLPHTSYCFLSISVFSVTLTFTIVVCLFPEFYSNCLCVMTQIANLCKLCT